MLTPAEEMRCGSRDDVNGDRFVYSSSHSPLKLIHINTHTHIHTDIPCLDTYIHIYRYTQAFYMKMAQLFAVTLLVAFCAGIANAGILWTDLYGKPYVDKGVSP